MRIFASIIKTQFLAGYRMDQSRAETPEFELPSDQVVAIVQENVGQRYLVDRVAGRGGTAWVCAAYDHQRKATVAVKLLRPSLAQSQERQRFEREIRVGQQIAHPHVMPVLDSRGDADVPWLAMPFAADGNMRRHIERHRAGLPLGAAMSAIRSAASAIGAVHRAGFALRDLTPENMLRGGGELWVTDLGAVRELPHNPSRPAVPVTPLGIGVGRFEYIAPEQLAGSEPNEHSDLYCWGVVAYEIFTGLRPVHATDAIGWRTVKEAREVVAINRHRPSVPAVLAALINRCLEPKPCDRPESADWLVARLDEIVTEAMAGTLFKVQPTGQQPESLWFRFTRSFSADKTLTAAAYRR